MLGAGLRDQRLRFQQRSVDENGDRLGDWEDGFRRWGRAVARTRGEVALQQRLQGVQPVEVTVLRDSRTRELTTAWRMLWNGVAYNIRAVTAAERVGAEIYILAEADGSNA